MNFINPFFEGKHRIVQVLFLLIFIVVGGMVFTGLGSLICMAVFHTSQYAKASNPAAFIRISQTFSSIGTFLLPALLFSYCQNNKWFDYSSANRKPHYLFVNVTLILSIVILPIVSLLSQWNEMMRLPESMASLENALRNMENSAKEIMQWLTLERSNATLVANVFALAVVPAICEEFMFQGTIQAFIDKSSGKHHLAIWVTAFIFSTIHFQFYGFIPRLLLGAYMGYLFYWSGSLWLPILAHFLHNALSVIIDYTMAGRGIMMDNVDYAKMKGMIPLFITCLVVTFISLAFMWRLHRDAEK